MRRDWQRKAHSNTKHWIAAFIIIILVIILMYVPLPFFISKPGDAVVLTPIITIEGMEDVNIEGEFMLTTVRMRGATPITYAMAKWDELMVITPKANVLAHYRDEREYRERQRQVMHSSQELATLVAYTLLNRNVDVKEKGVTVLSTVEGMPAERLFLSNDMITHIDGNPILNSEELMDNLSQRAEGEVVSFTFMRQQKELEGSLEMRRFPNLDNGNEDSESRVGIGITPQTAREIYADPPITINTNRIGGPSAGLMFTLEIYNQLTDVDITKGYRIAGTGTINKEGQVGRIGGVQQKIAASDNAGADIFFVPYEQGREESNYEIAKATASIINSSMVIVPVDTIHEALDYLDGLPAK